MHSIKIMSVFTGDTFNGQVDTDDLDKIFRMFNLVDDADAVRLHKMGYRLPSMSAGDIVWLDDQPYICASTGWDKLSNAQAAAYSIEIGNAASNPEARGPFMPKMQGETLRYLGDGGYHNIAPDGFVTVETH